METDRGTRGAGPDRHWLEAALNLLRREVESGFLPAVSAAVYFRGERVAALCAGHGDPETKRLPVHAASPFLVEEGRFTLEDMFHTPIDLVEIDQIRNPYFKEAVDETKVPVYEIA